MRAMGIIRPARRPAGWIATGPRPAGPGDRADGLPSDGEDLCYLCGDWRIFQKLDGHRFSLDDLVTAWYALESVATAPGAVSRALDLGCGSGSVLLMVAWRLGEARVLGVEAQEVSVGLARRSIAWNGVTARCEVRGGDLREEAMVPEGAVFDLVTGTPPYIPLGDGVVSQRVQRGPACFELRGGIEDYAAAAARCLAPRGRFVVCHSDPLRTRAAAHAAGLAIADQRAIVPREGRDPLFWVFAMGRASHGAPAVGVRDGAIEGELVVRDSAGQWTAPFRDLRRAMGMPV